MTRIQLFLVAACAALLLAAWVPVTPDEAATESVDVTAQSGTHDITNGKDCVRTEFKTKLVKKACKEGGQSAAKKAMMKFMKAAKKKNPEIKNCKSCHTKAAADYPLTKDGLKKYKAAGGE